MEKNRMDVNMAYDKSEVIEILLIEWAKKYPIEAGENYRAWLALVRSINCTLDSIEMAVVYTALEKTEKPKTKTKTKKGGKSKNESR